MPLLTERPTCNPGLLSLADGFDSYDLSQGLPIPEGIPGTLLAKGNDAVWLTFIPLLFGGDLDLGILMNPLPVGSTITEEEARITILARNAEFSTEHLDFQGFVPTVPQMEEIEDRLRQQNIILRQNSHSLQHGTT